MAKAVFATIVALLAVLGSTILTVVSLVWGFGLEVKSWPVVIGVCIGHMLLAVFLSTLQALLEVK